MTSAYAEPSTELTSTDETEPKSPEKLEQPAHNSPDRTENSCQISSQKILRQSVLERLAKDHPLRRTLKKLVDQNSPTEVTLTKETADIWRAELGTQSDPEPGSESKPIPGEPGPKSKARSESQKEPESSHQPKQEPGLETDPVSEEPESKSQTGPGATAKECVLSRTQDAPNKTEKPGHGPESRETEPDTQTEPELGSKSEPAHGESGPKPYADSEPKKRPEPGSEPEPKDEPEHQAE